jgi:hypothetical protein
LSRFSRIAQKLNFYGSSAADSEYAVSDDKSPVNPYLACFDTAAGNSVFASAFPITFTQGGEYSDGSDSDDDIGLNPTTSSYSTTISSADYSSYSANFDTSSSQATSCDYNSYSSTMTGGEASEPQDAAYGNYSSSASASTAT